MPTHRQRHAVFTTIPTKFGWLPVMTASGLSDLTRFLRFKPQRLSYSPQASNRVLLIVQAENDRRLHVPDFQQREVGTQPSPPLCAA